MILQQYSNQGTLTISMVSLRKNSTSNDEFTEGKQTKMLINYVFSMWCENYGEIYLMKNFAISYAYLYSFAFT